MDVITYLLLTVCSSTSNLTCISASHNACGSRNLKFHRFWNIYGQCGNYRAVGDSTP